MNKEQLMKEIKNALYKGQSWSSFTITKKEHGFDLEYVYSGPKNAMSLEDVVIWKHGVKQVKPELPLRSCNKGDIQK